MGGGLHISKAFVCEKIELNELSFMEFAKCKRGRSDGNGGRRRDVCEGKKLCTVFLPLLFQCFFFFLELGSMGVFLFLLPLLVSDVFLFSGFDLGSVPFLYVYCVLSLPKVYETLGGFVMGNVKIVD